MKNNLFICSTVAFASLVTTGCIRTLEVTLPDSTQQIVVNTYLTDDEILPIDSTRPSGYNRPHVQLSQTAPALDGRISPLNDKTASVQITENGNVVATGLYTPYSQFTPQNIDKYELTGFKPQPYKTYTIRVKHKDYPETTSTETAPAPMQPFTAVLTIDSLSSGNGNFKQYVRKTTFTLQDDVNTADFYEIRVGENTVHDNGSGQIDTVVSQNRIMRVSQGMTVLQSSQSALVSDNTFNGQKISFFIDASSNSGSPTEVSAPFIRIYKITKSRFVYLKSVQQQQFSGNGSNPFAEASFVYSNMSNGFGIFSFGFGRTVTPERR